jgi:mono/diheme cytochrome c family protein
MDRHPGLVHPALTAGEATAAAAFLLRDQLAPGTPSSGFAWRAWLLPIDDAGLPDLDGLAPVASGTAPRIDASPAPRARHYALAFDAVLDVPAAGEWTFTTGSDDSSWLWIDGELVVRNEGLAPHRRRSGTVLLAAGQHDLRVVFTQAAGEASLEVLWSGPGVAAEELPAARAQVPAERLVPPSPWPAADEAAVARGRAAARARRCDACHAFEDPAFGLLPAPPPARPFAQLRPGPCPIAPAAPALLQASREAAQCEPSPAADLARAMLQDGCLACHRRDGQGGLPPAVQVGLATIEDLGDEGRLPPDLTAVGRRLRPHWLERVLAEGLSVRPYLRLRMPKVPPTRARQYAAWFAQVDGATAADGSASGHAVDAALVQRGQQLSGQGGRNCITCHGFAGHPSLGARGMDLAIQHERLQPDWLRAFLLEPTKLRPGTRMPALWWRVDDDARAEVAAIAAWLALGEAAPLPPGLRPPAGSSLLVPGERPLLHGAFLAGVSARCLCVGSDLRVHFAWDLAVPRLVWLWRGDFVDAAGTWHGRAGKLVAPAGRDWRVLDDLVLAGGGERRLRGQRRTPDGWPVLCVAAGDVEYEDEARAVLLADGAAVVRTLRAVRGALAVGVPPPAAGLRLEVGGAPARDRVLAPGEALEIVYRW